ncbi:hypothetical protein C8024_00035 [Sphingopyxis sp. BSNA05]|nr:hypothetical protein [Sphingopyxis sp. BSNA05]
MCGMSSVSPDHATAPLEAEQTPLGVQTLVSGVAPITPAQRLAMRANAPMVPKKAQRPADHGLFDTNSRNQIEMF